MNEQQLAQQCAARGGKQGPSLENLTTTWLALSSWLHQQLQHCRGGAFGMARIVWQHATPPRAQLSLPPSSSSHSPLRSSLQDDSLSQACAAPSLRRSATSAPPATSIPLNALFVMSDSFLRAHSLTIGPGVTRAAALANMQLQPCEEVNYTKLALQGPGLTKDLAFCCLHRLLQGLGETMASGATVCVDLGVGCLSCRERKLEWALAPRYHGVQLVPRSPGRCLPPRPHTSTPRPPQTPPTAASASPGLDVLPPTAHPAPQEGGGEGPWAGSLDSSLSHPSHLSPPPPSSHTPQVLGLEPPLSGTAQATQDPPRLEGQQDGQTRAVSSAAAQCGKPWGPTAAGLPSQTSPASPSPSNPSNPSSKARPERSPSSPLCTVQPATAAASISYPLQQPSSLPHQQQQVPNQARVPNQAQSLAAPGETNSGRHSLQSRSMRSSRQAVAGNSPQRCRSAGSQDPHPTHTHGSPRHAGLPLPPTPLPHQPPSNSSSSSPGALAWSITPCGLDPDQHLLTETGVSGGSSSGPLQRHVSSISDHSASCGPDPTPPHCSAAPSLHKPRAHTPSPAHAEPKANAVELQGRGGGGAGTLGEGAAAPALPALPPPPAALTQPPSAGNLVPTSPSCTQGRPGQQGSSGAGWCPSELRAPGLLRSSHSGSLPTCPAPHPPAAFSPPPSSSCTATHPSSCSACPSASSHGSRQQSNPVWHVGGRGVGGRQEGGGELQAPSKQPAALAIPAAWGSPGGPPCHASPHHPPTLLPRCNPTAGPDHGLATGAAQSLRASWQLRDDELAFSLTRPLTGLNQGLGAGVGFSQSPGAGTIGGREAAARRAGSPQLPFTSGVSASHAPVAQPTTSQPLLANSAAKPTIADVGPGQSRSACLALGPRAWDSVPATPWAGTMPSANRTAAGEGDTAAGLGRRQDNPIPTSHATHPSPAATAQLAGIAMIGCDGTPSLGCTQSRSLFNGNVHKDSARASQPTPGPTPPQLLEEVQVSQAAAAPTHARQAPLVPAHPGESSTARAGLDLTRHVSAAAAAAATRTAGTACSQQSGQVGRDGVIRQGHAQDGLASACPSLQAASLPPKQQQHQQHQQQHGENKGVEKHGEEEQAHSRQAGLSSAKLTKAMQGVAQAYMSHYTPLSPQQLLQHPQHQHPQQQSQEQRQLQQQQAGPPWAAPAPAPQPGHLQSARGQGLGQNLRLPPSTEHKQGPGHPPAVGFVSCGQGGQAQQLTWAVAKPHPAPGTIPVSRPAPISPSRPTTAQQRQQQQEEEEEEARLAELEYQIMAKRKAASIALWLEQATAAAVSAAVTPDRPTGPGVIGRGSAGPLPAPCHQRGPLPAAATGAFRPASRGESVGTRSLAAWSSWWEQQ